MFVRARKREGFKMTHISDDQSGKHWRNSFYISCGCTHSCTELFKRWLFPEATQVVPMDHIRTVSPYNRTFSASIECSEYGGKANQEGNPGQFCGPGIKLKRSQTSGQSCKVSKVWGQTIRK